MMKSQRHKLEKLEAFVEKSLSKDKTGHDFEHTKRVLNNALKIAKKYKEVNKDILIASCLLHDIAFKDGFVKKHHLVGAKQSKIILKKFGFENAKIEKIIKAIALHAGNANNSTKKPSKNISIEAKILRDADNIDALGSIGLIRMIEFCNSQGLPYFKSKNDGFDDSVYGGVKEVITWADSMLTPEGKKIGKRKKQIMIKFLKNY